MATYGSPAAARRDLIATKDQVANLTMDTSLTIPTATSSAGMVVNTGNQLLIEERAVPNMAVRTLLGGFTINHQGSQFAHGPQPNIPISAADPTNPRRDIVVADGAGGVVVRVGTPAGSPVDPTLNPGDVPLARVTVPALATQIIDANIDDLRQRRPIPAPKVKQGVIDTEHLATNSIDSSGVVADGAITAGKIASGGVSASAQIAADVVDANAMAADAITAANGALANASVTAGKIAVGGISASNQFAADIVDEAAMAADAITAANGALANAAVTAGKIAVGGISASNQFAADIVDEAAMAAGAITAANNALANGCIDAAALFAADVVDDAAIAADAITAANGALANGCIDASALFATGVVDSNALGSNVVNYAEIDDAVINEVQVEITSGQLLALNATPITIVNAPGANLYIEFISATLWLDYNSSAYQGIEGGEDLVFKLNNGSGPQVSGIVETTGFLDQTQDEFRHVSAALTYAMGANEPLVLHLLSGEITSGNSPLKVRVRYRVNAQNWV